jgi:esterase/lipase superfamily enzyme
MSAMQAAVIVALGGLFGALGLGARVVAGRWKRQPDRSVSDTFGSVRVGVGLVIAFLLGLAAMLAIFALQPMPPVEGILVLGLVGIAALAYAAADLIGAVVPALRFEADQPSPDDAEPKPVDTGDNVNLSFDEGAPAIQKAQADPRAVGLFFVTTRAAASEFSEGWFTGERASAATFGRAFVRIPEAHRTGKIELPMKVKLLSVTLYQQSRDPTKHFVIRTVETLDEQRWCELIGQFPAEEALVFVHGFNTSFEEGLFRNAQMIWDLKFRGIPVLFSWPSRGRVADYGYDRESALGARHTFINVLKLLNGQRNVKRIHILAHSMGNLLVLETLMSYRQDAAALRLNELLMAAPDVDRDNFKDLASAARTVTSGMTLYASSVDKALILSKTLAGQVPRAGDVLLDGPIVVPQIDSIDVTALGEEILGLNHSTYAQTRSILNDVSILIQSGRRPPDTRLAEIRGRPEGSSPPIYWHFAE